MSSTLCKNCPFKNAKKEEGHCTDLFIRKYHNSCVTYNIAEDDLYKDLDDFLNKNATKSTSKEAVKSTNVIVKDEHKK